jgi:uncharacterized membrane protein YdjX (TVP38/TMEM64 family)
VQDFGHQVLDLIRSAGPATFFLAMALLPAVGAPIAFFSISAGPLYGPQLGIPLVITLALAAITANMALSHLLASRALRPLLESLMKRLGYRLPRVESGDVNDLIVLLRVTPGVPFPVQNYLLGLAPTPFGRYLLISCLVAWPANVAFIVFGDALLHGKGATVGLSLLLLVALVAAIHLVRRHYRARSKTSK